MATVSKTKDSGRGGGGGGSSGRGVGDYFSVLHQLLSAGWPCLSKKKGERWRESKKRKAFNAAH